MKEQDRLFVAVFPPAPVLADVEALVRRAAAGSPGLSWVPPDRWHITLTFLGDLTLHRRRRLARALGAGLAGRPPEAVRLRGAGAFPSVAKAKVVWLGIESELAGLARVTSAAARSVGLEVERRPWQAHLTVARVRPKAGGGEAAAAVDALQDVDTGWTADEVVLVKSTLGPRAAYEIVDRWPLSGDGYQA